jgi:hypothetical protein
LAGGFSIHEEVLIKDWDREALERLLGYYVASFVM